MACVLRWPLHALALSTHCHSVHTEYTSATQVADDMSICSSLCLSCSLFGKFALLGCLFWAATLIFAPFGGHIAYEITLYGIFCIRWIFVLCFVAPREGFAYLPGLHPDNAWWHVMLIDESFIVLHFILSWHSQGLCCHSMPLLKSHGYASVTLHSIQNNCTLS